MVSHGDDPARSRLQQQWDTALAGDEGAYAGVLLLIAERLRRFYRSSVSTPEDDIEDLVQETLLAIHLKRATFQPGSSIECWVLAIARYKWSDYWRRRYARIPEGRCDLDLLAATTSTAPDRSDVEKDLRYWLGKLPSQQREAIELTRLLGLSTKEAASRLATSESSLKVLVHRGLKRLRGLSSRSGGFDADG